MPANVIQHDQTLGLPRFLTVAEAAEVLSLTPESIRDFIAAKQLVAYDVSHGRGAKARWRILGDDLEKFLATRRTTPAMKPMRRGRQARVTEFY